LIAEKYMLREGRELIPTAKAFQLMTLLRGLQVEELSRPELTGDWEHKLSLMERGQLSREAFMRDIADMTQRMVQKAKEYDRDTIPGDYATLPTPCPNCGGVVKENYRRFACTGADGHSDGCGFSFTKSPAGRTFETAEAAAFLRDRHIGPLDGFRSKAGWPFVAEMKLVFAEDDSNWKLEFDFGDDKKAEETGALVEFGEVENLGACPQMRQRCARARCQLCVRKIGAHRRPAHAQLRLQERQGHPAANGGGRAGTQTARHRQDRPVGQVCVHAHAPRVQGIPDLGRERGQGGVRVRAPRQQIPAAQNGCGRCFGRCPCGQESGPQDDSGKEVSKLFNQVKRERWISSRLFF
jgi:hypothetical protein